MQSRPVIVRFASTLVAIAMLGLTQTVRAEAPPGGYSFGIGPVQAATELAKRWTPIVQYLTEKTGIALQFKTAKDIPTFQQEMKEGVYDFAYINPYHYLLFHKCCGYTAFAREKDGALLGVMVVKKDGPVQNVNQLADQTVAFPSATALAATWLPVQMLRDKNIAVAPQYVNSMESVYRAVAKGLFPAGGGTMQTLTAMDPEVKNELRVLWVSEPLPPFTFASHTRVPKDVVDKVQKAMNEMNTHPQGLALLKAANFKGMDIAIDRDYDAMRKMNLQPVEVKSVEAK